MRKLLLLSLLLFSISAYSQIPGIITNGNDSGPGSLRQAILDINAQGYGSISNFQNYTVNLYSPLPTITVSTSVYIKGLIINGNGIQGPVIQSSTSYLDLTADSGFGVNFSSTSFYVTNTNSSGPGSLSRALDYAEQTAEKDYIYFNIPQTVPVTISGSELGDRNKFPICVDGTSQPANGYIGNMPKVVLNYNRWYFQGNNSELYGLTIKGTDLYVGGLYYPGDNIIIGASGRSNVFLDSYIDVRGNYCTIQNNYIGTDPNSTPGYSSGLSIYEVKNTSIFNNVISGKTGFNLIDLTRDTNTVIKGNKIGTNVSGTASLNSNLRGINAYSVSVNLTIGGPAPTDKNIFASFNYEAIGIAAYTCSIQGNYIGTDITGSINLSGPQGMAMRLSGRNITVGGNGVNEGNIIVSNNKSNPNFNGQSNIYLQNATKVKIYNNKIGVAKDGITPLGNSEKCIHINFESDSIEIGKINNGYGNIIANSDLGVAIQDCRQVTVRGNSFFNNASGIGIYLGNYSTLSNDNIPIPIINQLSNSLVSGTSLPNAIIDLYYSPTSSNYQGKTYIGTVTANGTGKWSYNGTITNPCLVTCTQTDTYGNTSEFTQGLGGVIQQNVNLCKGNSITLNASGGTNYSWSPTSGLSDATSATPIASPSVPTVYTLSVQNSNNGCSGTHSVVVNVASPFLTVNLPSDTTLCPGDSIELNAGYFNKFVSYSWSTGATTQKIKAGGVTRMYKVTLRDTCGFTVTDSILVTIAEDCGIISGYVYKDNNSNCTKDAGESPYNNAIIKVTPGAVYTNTDASGFYQLRRPFGTYSVTQVPINFNNVICPMTNSYSISLNSASKIIVNQNFGNQIISNIQDLKISIAATTPVIGNTLIYTLKYENQGTKSMSGSITLNLDSILIFNSSSTSYASKSKNSFTWTFSNLQMGQSQSIQLRMMLPSNQTLTGQKLVAKAVIDPIATDSIKYNNIDSISQVIRNSFDPNHKEVFPGQGKNGAIVTSDSILNYTIHFQNTGTSAAKNIIITDTLSNLLNVETIELGASSHPYTFKVSEKGNLKFTFKNINLPDSSTDLTGSQGYVSFKIHQVKDNPIGTIIKNAANIYFDYNDPIITDTAITTIVDCLIPVIALKKHDTICMGQSIILNAIVSEGILPYQFSWSPSDELSSTAIANPIALPTSDTKYVITVKGKDECSSKDSVNIIVHNLPDSFAGKDTTICEGGKITIGPSQQIENSYIWNTGETSSKINISPTSKDTLILKVSDKFGCSSQDSVIISVNPNPVANAGADKTICLGSSIQLTTPSEDDLIYLWNPTTHLDNPSIASPLFNPVTSAIYEYKLTVKDQNGCLSNDTVIINVDNCTENNLTNESINSIDLYPNPFNKNINIIYTLADHSTIQLEAFSSSGKKIKTIAAGEYEAGTYTHSFEVLEPGFYILKFNINNTILYKKVIKE